MEASCPALGEALLDLVVPRTALLDRAGFAHCSLPQNKVMIAGA